MISLEKSVVINAFLRGVPERDKGYDTSEEFP